jgi:hypothetical protein
MLAADVPAQQPQTIETAALKLAIARAEKAFHAARADSGDAEIEARRIQDEAAEEAKRLKKEAAKKMDAARGEYFKLIRELKGWREGCVTDEAQNLKCPPEAKK